MGSSASKPETGASPHVWKGSGPTSVSQNIVESLQSSTEANKRLPIRQTDASRAQTLELHIQARVAEELKKLQAKEAEAFKKAQEKLSELSEKDVKGQLSSPAVSKEVEALRKKLEERKQVRQLPESVETARSNVIRCLREHDRRPLDCWQEVENFKEEVRRLEKVWVDKVVS